MHSEEKEKYNHDHVSTLSVIVNLPDFENSAKSIKYFLHDLFKSTN